MGLHSAICPKVSPPAIPFPRSAPQTLSLSVTPNPSTQVSAMKRLPVLFALFLILPLAAHADEASRRVKAKEMVSLLHIDTLMQQMMDNSSPRIFAAVPHRHETGTPPTARLLRRAPLLESLLHALLSGRSLNPAAQCTTFAHAPR
jgi:hypothetical protein